MRSSLKGRCLVSGISWLSGTGARAAGVTQNTDVTGYQFGEGHCKKPSQGKVSEVQAEGQQQRLASAFISKYHLGK